MDSFRREDTVCQTGFFLYTRREFCHALASRSLPDTPGRSRSWMIHPVPGLRRGGSAHAGPAFHEKGEGGTHPPTRPAGRASKKAARHLAGRKGGTRKAWTEIPTTGHPVISETETFLFSFRDNVQASAVAMAARAALPLSSGLNSSVTSPPWRMLLR